jgi:hypothetical protein
MIESEVATLLGLMAVYDNRTIGELDVLAWAQLDVIRRNTFDVCKRAVVAFFDQEPDERGNVAYLDPHHLRRMVRVIKERDESNLNRRRARWYAEQLEATPGVWRDLNAEWEAKLASEVEVL